MTTRAIPIIRKENKKIEKKVLVRTVAYHNDSAAQQKEAKGAQGLHDWTTKAHLWDCNEG